jgi:hypothetical protein
MNLRQSRPSSTKTSSKLYRVDLMVAGDDRTNFGLVERFLLVGDAGHCGRDWKFDSVTSFDYNVMRLGTKRGEGVWDFLKAFWNDSVWSKVIAAAIIFLAGLIGGRLRSLWREPWSTKLTITNRDIGFKEDAGYPLKYHVEIRNDSSKVVEVRLADYRANKIPLQSFPPEVMQVRFNNKWFPTDPVDRVAVLPGQLCRAWVGLDSKKFNEVQAKAAMGTIGTLIVSANRKRFSFEL